MDEQEYLAVTYENCHAISGPFYHGTRCRLAPGHVLRPGFASNYEENRIANHVYFSALPEPAIWGAELSSALAGSDALGFIYLVEPTGPFEDDPNLTNKRFPGNPTRSYRSREGLNIVSELRDWTGHAPEVLAQMLAALAEKKRQGLAQIED